MNYTTNDYDSFLIDTDETSPTVFPGPSFEYDLYHQQTGIPRGALASTHSYNKATGLQYVDGSNFIMPTETLNIPLTDLDDDFDFSSNPAMFFPEPSSATTEYISPNTLVNTPTTPIKRIYPGMHSQQAAQAKAQQAQKQEQMARQQQQAPQGQKPLPVPSPTKTQPPKDPLVEESISKVLNRMRQASAVSASEDGDSPVTGMSHMPRMLKKEEDDMDDDEKLLASEEGKKLTSKERRQLRNKVSARAFRSRRKEYIGQLEGEVAGKVQEANDLRVQNQQLREENTRLTDLTRMLLSSQAFSGFLQELSQSGLPPPNIQKLAQQQKPVQAQAPPMKKDVSSNSNSQQMQNQQPRIGMALIPESNVDYSALQPSNGWMNTLPTNDFQVFAVTELPTPPVLDIECLSGKSASGTVTSQGSKDILRLPELPVQTPLATHVESTQVDDSVPLDPETFALYYNSSASNRDSTIESKESTANAFVEISDEDTMATLKKLCSDLDDSCEILAKYTSHME